MVTIHRQRKEVTGPSGASGLDPLNGSDGLSCSSGATPALVASATMFSVVEFGSYCLDQ